MSRYSKTPAFFFARGLLGVALLAGLAAVIVAIVTALSDDPVNRDVRLDFRRSPRVPGDLPRDDVSFSWSSEVGVEIGDPTRSLQLIDALPVLLLGLATMIVAWSLLVVVVDVQRGAPFEAKAARRLRRSAVVVAVAAIGHPVLTALAEVEVRDAAGRRRGFGVWDLTSTAFLQEGIPWLLLAAVLAVFGLAFGAGRKLADDTEGLV